MGMVRKDFLFPSTNEKLTHCQLKKAVNQKSDINEWK